MCPQYFFNDVREAHLVRVWEVFVIQLEQMIGISVQSQHLSPVVLIEVLPVVGVEESDVKLLDQLKAVILRLAEICIISPKGDDELFPHVWELVPMRNNFSAKPSEAVARRKDLITAPKRDISEQHHPVLLLILAGVRLCIIL